MGGRARRKVVSVRKRNSTNVATTTTGRSRAIQTSSARDGGEARSRPRLFLRTERDRRGRFHYALPAVSLRVYTYMTRRGKLLVRSRVIRRHVVRGVEYGIERVGCMFIYLFMYLFGYLFS